MNINKKKKKLLKWEEKSGFGGSRSALPLAETVWP
jgi:hypothetical protein